MGEGPERRGICGQYRSKGVLEGEEESRGIIGERSKWRKVSICGRRYIFLFTSFHNSRHFLKENKDIVADIQESPIQVLACVSNMKALSGERFLFRKSTQACSRAGTAYFLAVYNTVITVSGPICTSSLNQRMQLSGSYASHIQEGLA